MKSYPKNNKINENEKTNFSCGVLKEKKTTYSLLNKNQSYINLWRKNKIWVVQILARQKVEKS